MLGGKVPVKQQLDDDDDILPGASSQDEIFEDDEGTKSSSSEQQKHNSITTQGGNRLFDDARTTSKAAAASLLLLKQKVSSLAWDTYDQDRGRYAGQSRNHKQRNDDDASPSTPSTVSRSPSPSSDHHRATGNSKMIQSFITTKQQQPNRRRNKRLEHQYQVVDATVHQQIALGSALRNTMVDSSVESSPNPSKSWMSSDDDDDHSTSSGSGWESGDSDESSNAEQQVTQDFLPEGLIPRTSVEDMVEELHIGSSGLAALQELRRMLNEAASTDTDATFQIQGIEIPNYQAQVQQAVANYRRTTLQITDESYFSMLEGSSRSSGIVAM
jgi:hypothetical protein